MLVALLTAAVALAAASPALAGTGLPEGAGDPSNTWAADLGALGTDDVNVGWADSALRIADPGAVPAGQRSPVVGGMLVAAPHVLATPANRVRAFTTAATTGVDVDVRGSADGLVWSEWTPAGTALPATYPVVQVRVVLTGAAAAVRAVVLVADVAAAPVALAAAGNTYRIYATREGLVGGTTANGHVIVSRDHFVALPSRRGLAPKGTGDYTVRVCTTSGARCEFAPVWDVGPWNTTDDYWNPAATRQSWTDLPQGRPEAQAAYQSGYNGGKDQFGRTVANPAGIDLADGVFWDGLLLTDNSWVDVTYLWTGTGYRGVVGSGPLNIRASASSSAASKGYAATYAKVPIECWVTGQSIAGPYGTTTRWDRVGAGQYVSHAYISRTTGGSAPAC
ncbi:hypothetical protein KZZ52_28565 [Dactylosporangium sp. AC04546]|uniref:hypothetical protein n=1 Tax=Dactylosporangium sp. AC04546 TaxID=2862460 RepID=UPI001EDFE8D0|nr:hypothetical protein [Dactylosporangium sp. AC04546]WVK89223.1 hypothetical protein KZZ52_28565 [Dactylosporangium sp. AC04546]